jgi:ketosteroid isomerase-like protein
MKTLLTCFIVALALLAREAALGQATLSGSFRNMRLDISSGKPEEILPLTIDPSSKATIGIFRNQATSGFVDIDSYGEITSVGAGIVIGGKDLRWPAARASFFTVTQGDSGDVYTETGLTATCTNVHCEGIVTRRIDVIRTNGKTSFYWVAVPRIGSFDQIREKDSNEPLPFTEKNFGDGYIESERFGRVKVLIVASVERAQLILVMERRAPAAPVGGQVPPLEVRTSGPIPIMTKIGPIGKDERGETQYGTVYEDHPYEYPCTVVVGEKTQEGLIGARDGKIVVRYGEDIIDLSAIPYPSVGGFRTESKWRAVEPASGANPYVWLIRAEKGSYLEATFTSTGAIERLYASDGARGVMPIVQGAATIIIGGTTYDLRESALLLEFGHQSVAVSRLSGGFDRSFGIIVGVLSAALILAIVVWPSMKKRRLPGTRPRGRVDRSKRSHMAIQEVALSFVEGINARDVSRLYELMTSDHVFIDSDGTENAGRERMKAGWTDYFAMVPDYRVEVRETFVRDDTVVMLGFAEGTFDQNGVLKKENHWRVPAAWRAVVSGEVVALWQLYANPQSMQRISGRIKASQPSHTAEAEGSSHGGA